MNVRSISLFSAATLAGLTITPIASAAPVVLQNATATLSQAGFPVDRMIDGFFPTGSDLASEGWAIADAGGDTFAQTAVFETAADLNSASGFTLTFSIFSGGYTNTCSLGKFRLSYTTDNRGDFADALATGGDVIANWIELTPTGATSDNVITTFAFPGSNVILAQGLGDADGLETQTIIVSTGPLGAGITGLRLEALEDVLLPSDGPGRSLNNGNFVLREFQVDAVAVPEPTSLSLLGLGAVALLRRRRR